MVRPRKCRWIYSQPSSQYFKPLGIMMRELEEVSLELEEFEAVRLKDFENLEQKQIAKKMKISQPTLHRLLKSARKKIADALVNGKAIRIGGGNHFLKLRGENCARWRRNRPLLGKR